MPPDEGFAHDAPVPSPRTDVGAFLDEAAHPRRAEIDAVRRLVAAAVPALGERVKWNAPSFTDDGDDRVTLRLQPKDRVEIIFHRGAKRRTDAFEFVDPHGLIEWAAPDRGVVAVPDPAFIEQHRAALTELVAAWIVAAR